MINFHLPLKKTTISWSGTMDCFQLTTVPTGQRQEAELGLYVANVSHSPKPFAEAIGQTTVARWYDPYLNRWTQPDSIVPDTYNPQSWDRYSYVQNNPINYNDPTGHYMEGACGFGGGDCPIYKPNIVSREEWGAYAPGSFGNQTPSAPKYEGHFNEKEDGYKPYEGNLDDIYYRITIHHEGDGETHNVLAVQKGEMNEGFYDIGYHFVIGRDGTIYEGRDIGARGNHAYPNTGNLGILWLGDFNPGYDISDPKYGQVDPTDDPGPTMEQYNATVDLVVWLDQEYGFESFMAIAMFQAVTQQPAQVIMQCLMLSN